MNKLTSVKITNEIAKGYIGRMPDTNGLYLLVRASGTHSWQFRYQSPITKKEKIYTIGNYPQWSLAQARTEHDILKGSVSKGVCVQTEKVESRKERPIVKDSFRDIAILWNDLRKTRVGKTTWDKDWSRLERFIFPHFAETPLDEIQASDLLKRLEKVAEFNGRETAMRTMNHVASVLKYAMALGKIRHNVANGLTEYLPKPNVVHRSQIKSSDVLGKLIYTINNHDASHSVVGCALRIMPHVFARHEDFLSMKWSELDLKAREWNYIVGKTKNLKGGVREMKVFLSDQVMKILEDVKRITGNEIQVFHSSSSQKGYITQTAHNKLLRRLGFDSKTIQVHGFRGTVRTLGYEKLGVNRDVVEKCLAHKTSEPLGEAYDQTTLMPDRKKFYQNWSDYLTECGREHQKSLIKLASTL